ncbi:hypothetical protein QAD02_021896 [Eretmocerus hayati]|uniref:Uncharacterized protein n=1 Tax=Eretmocerus hayati TaxID=131215 RepID=A0ACC2PRS4_9HYME|nr:hypothetical protein QAD02_021896 [Eretmocerus hayati]
MTSAMFNGKEDLETYLLYELCTYPASLFNENGMIDSKQSRFVDKFNHSNEVLNNAIFIIDAGFLLHKVVWESNQPVRDIVHKYVSYVKNDYMGQETFVIFDGYPDDCSDSTESYQRFHRQKTIGPEYQINLDTGIESKQEEFLSNEKNKKRLIRIISQALKENGVNSDTTEEDANILIIKTAMAVALSKPQNNAIVVGEDLDLLVIMNKLACTVCNRYFL